MPPNKPDLPTSRIIRHFGLAVLSNPCYVSLSCEEKQPFTECLQAEICFLVWHTFVDGHQGDYFCRVIEDCVAGSSPEAHEAALRAMEYLQTGARRSLDEVLAAMDGYGAMRAA